MYPIFKRRQDTVELQLIDSIVRPGFMVLDIGANIGFYTKIFSSLVGLKGQVHAFEPEATNFNYLEQNLRTDTNVTLIKKAVSDKTGPLKIYLSNLLNVDHRTYPVDDYSHVLEINATTIDDYLTQNNIHKIDFIKMDIQGFEMAALKGMEKTLSNNPEIKMITELWPCGLKKAGNSAVEVYDYLTNLDFNLFLITEKELQRLTTETLGELKDHEQKYYNVLVCKGNFKHVFV